MFICIISIIWVMKTFEYLIILFKIIMNDLKYFINIKNTKHDCIIFKMDENCQSKLTKVHLFRISMLILKYDLISATTIGSFARVYVFHNIRLILFIICALVIWQAHTKLTLCIQIYIKNLLDSTSTAYLWTMKPIISVKYVLHYFICMARSFTLSSLCEWETEENFFPSMYWWRGCMLAF